MTFPDELRQLYRFTNGVTIDEFSLKILDLKGMLEFQQMLKNAGYPQIWGYLPFTDSNDSNPYCICCLSPLTGYVVLVSHDDSAKLTHRGLNAFFVALSELLEPHLETEDWQEHFDIEELRDDFSSSDRNDSDREIGRKLLDVDHTFSELDIESVRYIERNDAFRFATSLMGADQYRQTKQTAL